MTMVAKIQTRKGSMEEMIGTMVDKKLDVVRMSVTSSIERLGLMKCDIKRDIGASTRRITTFVTLFGRRITNKDALLC